MKKTALLTTIVIVLLFCLIGGIIGYSYGKHKNSVSQKTTEAMEFARDTGYKQSCVELAYALGMLSDEDYNSYLEASDKYDNEPNEKTLEELSKLVNRLIMGLPMWDILDENSKDSSI